MAEREWTQDEIDAAMDIDDDDEDAEAAEAEMNCGKVPGEGCTLAGTEWCDWDCPFNR